MTERPICDDVRQPGDQISQELNLEVGPLLGEPDQFAAGFELDVGEVTQRAAERGRQRRAVPDVLQQGPGDRRNAPEQIRTCHKEIGEQLDMEGRLSIDEDQRRSEEIDGRLWQ
ncbi:hypothetical protein [Mycolicibacterium pulveris]